MAKASDSLSLIGSLVPSGVIMPFGGATAPSGWLLCDGSAVSRTTYAALFAAIASAWGYGDNSTTFNLPDMRGRFPRGRDGGIARDPDRASRAVNATGGNSGDNVGSVQGMASAKVADTQIINGQATKATTGLTASSSAIGGTVGTDGTHTHGDSGHIHITSSSRLFRVAPSGSTHNLPASTFVGTGGTVNGNLDTEDNGVSTSYASINTTGSGHGHGTPTITVGAGDNETRPLNANVNYIIKI